MQIRTSQRVFITGKTRSGKSVFAESLLNLYPRLVFHDRKFEHGYLARQGYTILNNPKELVKALKSGRKRILYQPTDPSTEDFDIVCDLVYTIGNCCLVVDEAQSLCSSNKIPFCYSEILRLGATRNVGCISITQRPKGIYNTIISEAEFIIVFRLNIEDDRKKVIGTIGKKVTTANGKTISSEDAIREMKLYHFLLYDGEKSVLCTPIPYKKGVR